MRFPANLEALGLPITDDLPRDNAYGHVARVEWLKTHLRPDDAIMEFGCGTGYMVTYPLRRAGYTIDGYDLDERSIAYGIEHFCQPHDEPPYLHAMDVQAVDRQFDVVIASEVLEHIPDPELDRVIGLLADRLKPGGRLLVTVPNGYGWFELESFLWYKLGLGKLLTWTRLARAVLKLKQLMIGNYYDAVHVSTLDASPHVQRFTWGNLKRRLEAHGFTVYDRRGAVLFSGPFSHTCFTGIRPIMALNRMLGSMFPWFASGFYAAARRR